jgi:signal transduction histidine kinase
MASSSREVALMSLVLHELRTPLNVATGSLAQLLGQGAAGLSPAHRALAERASRACSSLDALAQQMRAWIGVHSAATTTTAPLAPLLHEAAAAAQEISGRGVRAVVSPMSADMVVSMRGGGLLGPALQSLIGAVARAAADGATVAVEVSDRADLGVAHVAIGQLGDASPASGFPVELTGGLGFELALARAVIEASRGRVWSHEIDGRVAGVGVELQRM